MPDTQIPPDDSGRRQFLAEWQASVEPFDRRAREAAGNAASFAATGLRALFLLNGGALIVFPAYLTLLGSDVDAAYVTAVKAAVVFLAGLVLAAIATLLAYFSELARGQFALRRGRDAAAALQDAFGAGSPPARDFRLGAAATADDGAKSARRAGYLRAATIAVALLSLACFAGGGYFAALAVLTGPANDDTVGASRINTPL